MRLYKYLSPEVAKLTLDNLSIRLTPRVCLNDPFELLTTNNLQKKFSVFINPDLFQEVLDFSGVISLTETDDNLLMWSHYAKEHSGAIIGFDINTKNPYDLFMLPTHANHPFVAKEFSKVTYRKSRSYPDGYETNTEDAAKFFYLSKSDEWIYEKEFRYILPFHVATEVTIFPSKTSASILSRLKLKNSDPTCTIETSIISVDVLESLWKESKLNNSIFTIRLNPQSIKSVLIGNKCDNNLIKDAIKTKNIKNLYDENTEQFKNVFTMTLHRDRYELVKRSLPSS